MTSCSHAPQPCWCDAPARLKLQNDEVHVWRAFFRVTEPIPACFRSILSPDELAKADRFYFAKDRGRSIVARAVLRLILSRYLDAEPARLRFCYNAFGKPALTTERNADGLQFNVSHSDELAIIGVARGREIGVDVEHIREGLARDEIAKRFFSPSELEMLRALPCDVQTRGFFNCWTRKEAYMKARGEGLSLPLEQFDVSVIPGEPAALLSGRESKLEASHWSLRDLPVQDSYAAAIAVQGHGWRLKCWQWS